MKEWIFRAALAVLAVIALAPAARAQNDADAREMKAYRLTMDAVRKVAAATDVIMAEMKKDPKYQAYTKLEAEIQALEKKEERSDAEQARLDQLEAKLESLEGQDELNLMEADTLADFEATLRKHPPIIKGLQSVGMTPREFSKFFIALLEASVVVGFQGQGFGAAAKDLAVDVSPENIKFVKEHQAELKALMQKWENENP